MTTKDCVNLALSDWERYLAHNEVSKRLQKTSKMGGGISMIINGLLIRNHRAAFCFWLRMSNTTNKFIRFVAKWYWRRLYLKFGLQILPATKIGKGFYIGHGIGIVIHPLTIIGENCNISQFTTIGSNKNTPATIGNNVYIGPGVSIVENVKKEIM